MADAGNGSDALAVMSEMRVARDGKISTAVDHVSVGSRRVIVGQPSSGRNLGLAVRALFSCRLRCRIRGAGCQSG